MAVNQPRSRLEDSLFASELGLALFNYSPDGILLVDSEGLIQMANRQVELMFGWPRTELIGQQVETLIPPDLTERHRQHRAGYTEDPVPRSMGINLHLVGRRRSGSDIPVEISLGPVVTDRGLFTAVTIRRARSTRTAASDPPVSDPG